MANHRLTEHSSHTCTATMTQPRFPACTLYSVCMPSSTRLISHLPYTKLQNHNPLLTTPLNTDETQTPSTMPVPMPSNSSSEKSDSTSSNTTTQQSSAAAQAIQDIGRSANEALASAGIGGGQQGQGEKSEAEKEAERRYEEAMEDEYAKREGGA